MKVAVCIYHENINNIYPQKWINDCIDSLKSQTFKDFKVFEIDYGDENIQLWDKENVEFYNKKYKYYVQAQNFIFDMAFDWADVVFNVNIDDFYTNNRIERQLQEIEKGYDLVCSDFQYVTNCPENSSNYYGTKMIMHKLDIAEEQNKEHNIICHPVIAMTKKFWERNKYYKVEDYKMDVVQEDFQMWKKAVKKKENIIIIPEILCYQRLHNKQESKPKNKYNNIIVASMGRCGSTLFYKALQDKNILIVDLKNLFNNNFKSVCPMKTHDFAPDELPIFYKVVFLFGNPYDIVLSSHSENVNIDIHYKNLHSFYNFYNKKKIFLLKDTLRLEENFDSWYKKQSFPLLTIRYETMWDNINIINKFLGFEISLPEKKDRNQLIKRYSISKINILKKTYLSLFNKIQNAEDIKIW